VSPVGIAWTAFGCVFGSALLGLFLQTVLPTEHLSQESKDVVKLGTGLIATMAALVLSLLISSAKSSFDRVSVELLENAARVISLDRVLADYGPETRDIRDTMKRGYAARLALLFHDEPSQGGKEDSPDAIVRTENLRAMLWDLSPQTDAQRGLRSQAVEIAAAMSATRWLMLLQTDETIPVPLMVVLVCWLSIIFAAFGMFAPRNGTVIAMFLVCALSVAGAILLILEMDTPFTGVMKVSSAPMRDALADLGK